MVQIPCLNNAVGPGTASHLLQMGTTQSAANGHASACRPMSKQYHASSYTFHDLHKVDLIFDEITMAVNKNKKVMAAKQFQVLGIRCYVLNPTACVHRMTTLVKTARQRSHLQDFPSESLYLLLVHTRLEGHLLTWHSWLTLVEVMLQEPRFSRLSWPAAHLISSIRLTRTSKIDQSLRWLHCAIGCLLVVVFQFISVELTIRWNSIRGLQNIGTVGQLVPLMIVVGGLSNVSYCECKARWFGQLLCDTEEDSGRLSNQDLGDAYYGCRRLREKLNAPLTLV
jgi:hypothetical protein